MGIIVLDMLMRILSIMLACCLVSQTFSSLTMIAYFKVQQDYIEEAFCINKDKPQMNCKGKCFLSERLKQQQKEKEEPATSVDFRQITFLGSELDVDLFPDYYMVPKHRLDERCGDSLDFHEPFFHPPMS